MSEVPDKSNLEDLIKYELGFFFSEEMKDEFLNLRIPPYEVRQRWGYGKESHRCIVFAKDSRRQLVFCQTGFGPDFPWSCQDCGETDLGMDARWCAYLVEAFAEMWEGDLPEDFMLMGPGEREELAGE